ncbi:MAG TPA: radical SAM protein [Nitrososphaera sp.]|jgi:DNA repair photolyase
MPRKCIDVSALWYKGAVTIAPKKSKSLIHPFVVRNYNGLTINPYQGCGHRCAYCYATYQWSPDFYDKIYAKSNAAEVLEGQLRKWKSDTIGPVMVSSATDCYQPAELRYGLTRKCIEVLQRYNVPYYVFTKSSIIERDLELHKRYSHNCSIIWSITTCNEKVRRIIEPGTPPAIRIFATIKKFTDAGISCGVNVDPIIPLVTDSDEELDAIIIRCRDASLKNVVGSLMRLRADIWDRMKIVLKLLEVSNGEEQYRKIYGFQEPLESSYLSADRKYEQRILDLLYLKVKKQLMLPRFPGRAATRMIDRAHFGQTTLASYLA